MKVHIVIEHIDRGSDEFRIAGVFDDIEKARKLLRENYIEKGWGPLEDDVEDMITETGKDINSEDLIYYRDPEDEYSDNVRIETEELQ